MLETTRSRETTWGQVLAWRMRRQFLTDGAGGEPDPVAVARRLAGVQAQVAGSAAAALRVRGAGPPGPALESGALLKTWAMRGTLHLLPRDRAAAVLALCATVRSWEKPSWTRAFGATPEQLAEIAGAAREVLDGQILTREELAAEVVARTGNEHLREALGSGWGALLKPLAWWGVLCHGPSRGSKITFTAPKLGEPPAVEDAARVVIGDFLGAHGPASPEMFDAWLTRGSSRKRELRSWFAACGDELAQVWVEGEPMYVRADQVEELLAAPPAPEVALLGAFDPYVLGAGTSCAALIPPEHRAKVSRTAGWIAPVVLRSGRVAGTWDPATGEADLWEEVPRAALQAAVRAWPGGEP
ncbi:winged helix DNA-binding domain-containing protein [Actinocorallia sp. API 0066]|uniref:DNA glycosylase AlkZ-like family protein n=1 Tax=Actinocorallia sp. API 0066 TaxID=2896846 RepID=UPI001E2DA4CA|nr:crosslink repair DNA glycosylase YcaQ family protein [Actinocorallia sp. API 0066]MCD0451823.1 winged helix DNA-binding domain-containing protein [Actinocorallia sp. API 0066]